VGYLYVFVVVAEGVVVGDVTEASLSPGVGVD